MAGSSQLWTGRSPGRSAHDAQRMAPNDSVGAMSPDVVEDFPLRVHQGLHVDEELTTSTVSPFGGGTSGVVTGLDGETH